MLQCFHSFCHKCLTRLETRDQEGQFTLTCPNCRHITPAPTGGVAGLQPALHLNPFLEIVQKQSKVTNAVDSLASASEQDAKRRRVDTPQKVYPEQEMKPYRYKKRIYSNEIYKAQYTRQMASIENMMMNTLTQLNDLSLDITRGT